jgi:hypothetical protein
VVEPADGLQRNRDTSRTARLQSAALQEESSQHQCQRHTHPAPDAGGAAWSAQPPLSSIAARSRRRGAAPRGRQRVYPATSSALLALGTSHAGWLIVQKAPRVYCLLGLLGGHSIVHESHSYLGAVTRGTLAGPNQSVLTINNQALIQCGGSRQEEVPCDMGSNLDNAQHKKVFNWPGFRPNG